MKEKRGFTLIELLAVIVILAVIALIATPIVLNIIEKARKSAFQDSAYGLIDAARLQYTEGLLDGSSGAVEYDFDGATGSNLKFSGSRPNGGKVVVDSSGNIGIAVHNNKWCAKKELNETSITMSDYNAETCKLTGTVPPTNDKTFEEVMNESSEIMTNDPDNNKRYVGANPNNYVKFNNELWRVIGVFGGQAKIIRNDFYSTGKAWDSGNVNNWATASLQTELNGTYLNGITEPSKSYIDTDHVWNLGGTPNDRIITRSQLYTAERGTTVYSGRPTTWTGAIGLMYPSDWGYATSYTGAECDSTALYSWDGSGNVSNCKNNSWLYNSSTTQWTLTPFSGGTSYVFYANTSGWARLNNTNNTNGVRPTLYLNNNVKIKSGAGTETDPFILTM